VNDPGTLIDMPGDQRMLEASCRPGEKPVYILRAVFTRVRLPGAKRGVNQF
jgi:hypothetical protein